MSMYTDPNHIKVSDPGNTKDNPTFIYLDAFSTDEHFQKYLPEYKTLDELKAHYENGGIIVVRDWRLANDVENVVRGVESSEHDEKDLATVFCKSKSGAPYTGVVQGNTSDLEGEIDEMVANAKSEQ